MKLFRKYAIGIDEVGTGAVAGPVVSVAVLILADQSQIISIGINDSKAMTEKKRESVNEKLIELSHNGLIQYGIGVVDAKNINNFGIVASRNESMKAALDQLNTTYNSILIDGIVDPFLGMNQKVEMIVKGDASCYNIAAASIIAKVFRDELMKKLSKDNITCYNWKRNKGYATAEHIKAIKLYGLSEEHRKSFCKNFIYV